MKVLGKHRVNRVRLSGWKYIMSIICEVYETTQSFKDERMPMAQISLQCENRDLYN
jgi:hypothetical protein